MKTLTILLFLFSCPFINSTDDWKENRPVSSFSGLSVGNGIDVYLMQGNDEKLTIEAKGVDQRDVISEVRNGTLKLSVERRRINVNFGRSRSVKAYVTFRQLSGLAAAGGAKVVGQGKLSFRDLNVSAAGGADVKLNLTADDLNASASGGADMVLVGTARTLNADGTGGADLDARKLTVETGNANSSGGSDVYIYATRELNLKASGGSDIYYYGPARVSAQSKSGGSDITRKN